MLKNRYTELALAVFAALAVMVFYGSNSEGQVSLFNTWVRSYVEEKALALDVVRQPSSMEMADMNSVFAGTGGDGSSESPAPSTDAATIHESAVAAVMPPDGGYLDEISGHRSGVIDYTVQDGDLLSFIASDFGVSQQSLIWANNLKDADNITPGQVLRIPPVTGVIHTAKAGDTALSLAKKYSGDVDRIIAYNQLPKDGAIDAGDEIIIPDGHPSEVSMPITSGTPTTSIDRQIRRVGTYTQAGSALTALKFGYLPDLGDYFMTPAAGFNWGILHDRNGVDIADSCGTPIYAAADGTVTVADATGYNGGFGKYIKISHPNGTETLYGHTSKILVSVGQVVGKGDKIALMGTTGRSTGCHLHFEVHGARNPLAKY